MKQLVYDDRDFVPVHCMLVSMAAIEISYGGFAGLEMLFSLLCQYFRNYYFSEVSYISTMQSFKSYTCVYS